MTCTNFGIVNGMSFVPSKSHCLTIYPGKIHISCSDIDLNGQKLKLIDKLKYLGVYIKNNFKQLFDVSEQVAKFYSSFHSVASCCNMEMVRLEILKRQCAPILFYGLDAIKINGNIVNIISKAWNCAIRMIFNIRSRQNPCHLLYFCNSMSASFNIDQLQMGMLLRHRYNPNHLVSTCCQMLSHDNLSYAAFNKYNVPLYSNVFRMKTIVWHMFEDYCFA